jgi:nucleotidyltransferase/DNA polymerase involved in DNA repair
VLDDGADVAPRTKEAAMQSYVIERAIPGIGGASATELQAIAQKSCGVLAELGPDVSWKHSYVTGDKIYCVYEAASEDIVREHAQRGGFPADSVSPVLSLIGPETAKG